MSDASNPSVLMAADRSDSFFRFYGDANGDRRVDVADLGLFAGTYLKTSADSDHGNLKVDPVNVGAAVLFRW